MSSAFVAVLLAAVSLASLVLLFLVARTARRHGRARALVAAGRTQEARATAEELAASWVRHVPGARDAASYLVAITRHLDGDLEGALEALRRLDAIRAPDLRYAARSLEAATLVLLERDPARALAAIDEARAIRERPEDALVLAHVLRALGRRSEADALHASAAGSTSKETREPAVAAAARYFEGAFVLAVDEPRARAALTAARDAAPGTIYARRAALLLSDSTRAPARDDEDPRSSLAPQMLGPGASRP